MCMGTIGQITGMGPDRCVEVLAGDRAISGSLLAVSDTVGLGDWVVVHSGLVLARLTEQEARDALDLREPPCEGAP
jgi:hydrogenase maturation factor